jgi:ABC-type lipoprotein release transport system permease subunit
LCGVALLFVISRYVADIQIPGILSFGASALIIVGAAISASLMPARRAAQVNAVEALRAE